MMTEETLKDVFGAQGQSYFRYLSNKNKGGINNTKGNTFENFFAVYRIAKAFNEGKTLEDTYFSSQDFCFVDDLIVQEDKDARCWFYQIKDVAGLNWNNRSENSMESDFLNQHKYCQMKGIIAHLGLVVSEKDVHAHLTDTKSDLIVDKVEVIQFEAAASINNLLRNNQSFKEEIKKMCGLNEPSKDKLNALATIVLGAWDGSDRKKVSLSELIDRCYAQNPHYIRGTENWVSKKLKAILEGVEGFSYAVAGGYINWKFGRKDSGTLSFRIGSREYEEWENKVFNTSIHKFEDIEPFLQ